MISLLMKKRKSLNFFMNPWIRESLVKSLDIQGFPGGLVSMEYLFRAHFELSIVFSHRKSQT